MGLKEYYDEKEREYLQLLDNMDKENELIVAFNVWFYFSFMEKYDLYPPQLDDFIAKNYDLKTMSEEEKSILDMITEANDYFYNKK